MILVGFAVIVVFVALAPSYALASAGECFTGQEPHSDTGQPIWSVPGISDPCSCHSVRLGGLNTARLAKPREVVIGGDGRVLSKKPLEANCTQEKVSVPTTPCEYTTTDGNDVYIPEDGNFTSYPVRLEFTVVQASGFVRIRFKDPKKTLYGVVLKPSPLESYIYKVGVDGFVATVSHSVVFGPSSPFRIMYDAGQFKVGITNSSSGYREQLMVYEDSEAETNVVKRVSLHTQPTQGKATWKFSEPCESL